MTTRHTNLLHRNKKTKLLQHGKISITLLQTYKGKKWPLSLQAKGEKPLLILDTMCHGKNLPLARAQRRRTERCHWRIRRSNLRHPVRSQTHRIKAKKNKVQQKANNQQEQKLPTKQANKSPFKKKEQVQKSTTQVWSLLKCTWRDLKLQKQEFQLISC